LPGDGTPLVRVDESSESKQEGARIIQGKRECVEKTETHAEMASRFTDHDRDRSNRRIQLGRQEVHLPRTAPTTVLAAAFLFTDTFAHANLFAGVFLLTDTFADAIVFAFAILFAIALTDTGLQRQ